MTEAQTPAADTAAESNQPGMPAEHALLGLLAMSESGVGHGYELARGFESGAPLGEVIRLEPGMVYHHLKKLERPGWVTMLPGATPGRQTRRPFSLSAEGREALDRWLAEPVAHTREIRLDFLVKLYLALQLDPALALRLIDEQRDICARLIASLGERLRGDGTLDPEEPHDVRFGEMVLDMRLAQTQAALAWLDRVRGDAAVATVRGSA